MLSSVSCQFTGRRTATAGARGDAKLRARSAESPQCWRPMRVRIRSRGTDEAGSIGAAGCHCAGRHRTGARSGRARSADPANPPAGHHKAGAAAATSSARDGAAATACCNDAASRRRARNTGTGQAVGRDDERNTPTGGTGCTRRNRTIRTTACAVCSIGRSPDQARIAAASSNCNQPVSRRTDISGAYRGATAGPRRWPFQLSAC